MSLDPISSPLPDPVAQDCIPIYEACDESIQTASALGPIFEEHAALEKLPEDTFYNASLSIVILNKVEPLALPALQNILNKVEDALRARGFFTQAFEKDVSDFNQFCAELYDTSGAVALEMLDMLAQNPEVKTPLSSLLEEKSLENLKAELSAGLSEQRKYVSGPLFPILNVAALCALSIEDVSEPRKLEAAHLTLQSLCEMTNASEIKDDNALIESMQNFANHYRESAQEINKIAPYLICGAEIAKALIKLPEVKALILELVKEPSASEEANKSKDTALVIDDNAEKAPVSAEEAIA